MANFFGRVAKKGWQASKFDIFKKKSRLNNSKLKKKLINSSKKLKVLANFDEKLTRNVKDGHKNRPMILRCILQPAGWYSRELAIATDAGCY